MTTLGRLKKVELREAWRSESGDFTPWLAREENLKLLGDVLEMALELEAQEKDVGPFRADILCTDTATGAYVLIENQLERTDHGHLGQLLTYSAGLDAATIVWVAREFTEEHRAALDWLNEITGENVNFFGLEIELWQIGNSDIAPKFNIVSKPNTWRKQVSEPRSLSTSKAQQLDFWMQFAEYLNNSGFKHARVPKPYPQHWMQFSIGRSGFIVSAIASMWDTVQESWSGELRVEMSILTDDSKALFAELRKQKDEIEKAIGEEMTWYEVEGVRTCRVCVRQSADVNARTRWPEYNAWLKARLDRFFVLFRPIVAELRLPEEGPGDAIPE